MFSAMKTYAMNVKQKKLLKSKETNRQTDRIQLESINKKIMLLRILHAYKPGLEEVRIKIEEGWEGYVKR